MNETEALQRMVAPAGNRPSKPYLGGVIQILVTSSCDKSCFNCTQLSQIARPKWFMTPEQFEQAVMSLSGYWGVIGTFGGNPCLSPHFKQYCEILRKHVPLVQRGLWSNNPITLENAQECARTFHAPYSNLNVHLDQRAYDLFKQGWPECNPVGLREDSRHSPPFVAMRDVLKRDCDWCKGRGMSISVEFGVVKKCPECNGAGKVYDEERAWELIAKCPINQFWSAGIGVFRSQLRGFFCEIAMAQSIYHQDEPDYPDTGVLIFKDGSGCVTSEAPEKGCEAHPVPWWQLPMTAFASQVRKHCHECGVPMQGHGELAQSLSQESKEQVSETHAVNYKPKRQSRRVELVTVQEQLGKPLERMTNYLGNARLAESK